MLKEGEAVVKSFRTEGLFSVDAYDADDEENDDKNDDAAAAVVVVVMNYCRRSRCQGSRRSSRESRAGQAD